MADSRPAPAAAAADAPAAAAIRALRDAVAGLGRTLGRGQHENSNTVIHLLGARLDDVQALHEYLAAHEPPKADPQ